VVFLQHTHGRSAKKQGGHVFGEEIGSCLMKGSEDPAPWRG
jgi:hypothetical protein